MAITASGLYVLTVRDALQNDIALDLVVDTLKVALVTNSHTPNFDTDSAWNSTNEVGTPSGGITLTTPTLSVSSGSLVFDGDDTAWGSQTMSDIRAARIYDSSVSDRLVCLVNFGGDYAVTSGVFTIQWHATGIFAIDLTP